LFRWYSSTEYEAERADRLRLDLLRSSYRLSAQTYERPHRIAGEAAATIGVDALVVLYQLHHGEAGNAALFFADGEAHVVLAGPLLTALDDRELAALFGHELAHHKLFTLENGSYRVATELIEATAAHAGAASAFVEAAARNRRWTEIFADRGAAIAAGAIEPAIATLVKLSSGLAHVSVDDYLAQAREVVAKLGDDADRGDTHPENAIRALALELWDAMGESADDEIAAWIDGSLRIEALDITQQRDFETHTRALLDHVLEPAWMRTEATLTHARRFFPSYEWAQSTNAMPRSSSVDEFVAYVLLDFAVADAALGEVALARALTIAGELGIDETFVALARKELKATASSLSQLAQRAPSLFERAAKQAEEPA
jgi:hypothetical protein